MPTRTRTDRRPLVLILLLFVLIPLFFLIGVGNGSGPNTDDPGSSAAASATSSAAVETQITLAIDAARPEPDTLRAPANTPLVLVISSQPGERYALRIVGADGLTAAQLGTISNGTDGPITTYFPLRRPDGSGRLREGLSAGRYTLLDDEGTVRVPLLVE